MALSFKSSNVGVQANLCKGRCESSGFCEDETISAQFLSVELQNEKGWTPGGARLRSTRTTTLELAARHSPQRGHWGASVKVRERSYMLSALIDRGYRA